MVNIREGTLQIGGKSLFTKTWLPDEAPKAKLIFFHGFSDHVDRYYDFFPYLANRGIAVYGLDQRGWGRSALNKSEWGLTGPTSQVLSDMAAFLEPQLPNSPSDPPVFVMGHSMGGGQALMLAGSDDYADLVKRVRGWMCESPYIGLSPGMQPSTFIVVAGRLGAKILPHKKMVNGVPPEKLSRDPEVVRSLANDPLLHNTGTLEGLSGMLDRSLALTGGKVKMRRDRVQALWVGHGTEDLGTSCEATKRWFENCTGEVGDRVMKVYEGWFHQLHAEPGKEEFYEDVARWILERAGGGKEWRAGAEALEGEGEGSDVKTTGSETLEAKTIEAKL